VLFLLLVKEIFCITFMQYGILYNPYGHQQVPSNANFSKLYFPLIHKYLGRNSEYSIFLLCFLSFIDISD
jgi:hypothetical protein